MIGRTVSIRAKASYPRIYPPCLSNQTEQERRRLFVVQDLASLTSSRSVVVSSPP